jgi:hypothetical protein
LKLEREIFFRNSIRQRDREGLDLFKRGPFPVAKRIVVASHEIYHVGRGSHQRKGLTSTRLSLPIIIISQFKKFIILVFNV